MSESKSVAFVGLGVMGYPMAGHLARAGHSVKVYNRTAAVAERWLGEYPGVSCASPAEAARDSEIVCCCVGNDEDVRAVTLAEDGIVGALSEAAILVDHTTASAGLARELEAACQVKGAGFLDAPVSGGQAGAQNGQLTIMVGGEQDAYERAAPMFDCYAKSVKRLGPAGSGQLTKMVNQLCIAGVLQGLAEGLHFAEQAGLDLADVVEVISQGAAQSWQMDNRAQTMAAGEFEFGFAVDWMRKDLDITLRTARSVNARLPLAALVDQFYADVQAYGGARWDTSSLIERLRRS
jgi:3-hydroxyisobutyrate dehydrogenase-like beta-hydroxyacid dehydrogenase